MIIGSGFDRSVGGASGTGYLGLPYPQNAPPNLTASIWYGMDRSTQELYLQDLNRNREQATYYQDSDYARVYDYKTQFDESIIDPIKDTGQGIIDTATNVGKTGLDLLVLGLVGAFVLGRK